MLKLVLGGSGSGKTTLLYARIKARAEAGQRSILLAGLTPFPFSRRRTVS